MNTKSSYWLHAIESSEGLNTVDRLNEILFGLIMVLTFTCSISAATAGHEELPTILWSALGCNVAWGLIDALMYLFAVMLGRGEMFDNVRKIRNATTSANANAAIREALPSAISSLLKAEHINYLNEQIKNLPEPPSRVSLVWQDLWRALAIFLMVFLSTFPVTLPFLFIRDISVAIRISNAIALILLFTTGVYLARHTGRQKILSGLAFTFIGFLVVSVTMALGG